MVVRERCAFVGCEGEVCLEDASYTNPNTLRFCQKHADEINHLIDTGNAGGLFLWWVEARGGIEAILKDTIS